MRTTRSCQPLLFCLLFCSSRNTKRDRCNEAEERQAGENNLHHNASLTRENFEQESLIKTRLKMKTQTAEMAKNQDSQQVKDKEDKKKIINKESQRGPRLTRSCWAASSDHAASRCITACDRCRMSCTRSSVSSSTAVDMLVESIALLLAPSPPSTRNDAPCKLELAKEPAGACGPEPARKPAAGPRGSAKEPSSRLWPLSKSVTTMPTVSCFGKPFAPLAPGPWAAVEFPRRGSSAARLPP